MLQVDSEVSRQISCMRDHQQTIEVLGGKVGDLEAEDMGRRTSLFATDDQTDLLATVIGDERHQNVLKKLLQ
jgi:hypothetical protein